MNALIRRQLSASAFGDLLATFNGEPAIFCQKAPDDSAFDDVFPHAIFSIDKFSDAVHGVAGLLTVDIICSQQNPSPETLEKLCRRALEGVFFAPDDGEIFALKWQKTDIFQEPASERMPLVVGATLTFEVREFPSMETADPDPIHALNLWATDWEPRIIAIASFAASGTPEIFEPCWEMPAVYFDLQRTQMLSQTHTSTTLQSTVNAHVFCKGVAHRRTWITSMLYGLLNTRAIFALDGSPMRLTACEFNAAADEIQGQLALTLEYTLLKPRPYAHTLNVVHTNFGGLENVQP